MYDPILVPVDGSRRAEHVIAYVAALAGTTGSRVVLLRAIEPPSASSKSRADSQQRLASNYLARVSTTLQGRRIATSTEVLAGTPADIIVRRATDFGAGLIAISTRGRGGLGRLLFGSVATAVARTAAQPVFVVRPTLKATGELRPPRRILALVGDGDTINAGPAGHAAAFAQRYGAALTLLRISVSVAALRAGSGRGTHPRELIARQRLDSTIAVAELARDLRERGIDAQHEAFGGDAVRLALRRARQLHADLVVVGAAGAGSVAEDVARQAPCPVLIADNHPAPVDWVAYA